MEKSRIERDRTMGVTHGAEIIPAVVGFILGAILGFVVIVMGSGLPLGS